MPKIMMSAGELSGDVHGARLVEALRARSPGIEFFGMGSQNMAAAGVRLIEDLTHASTIGLLEPLRHLPRIWSALRVMKHALRTEKPDLLIVIDFQGFHMMLIKYAHQLGIPVVYYIAPQHWQWGSESGGQSVVDLTDKILAIFPEESDFYRHLSGNVTYVGHPLLDIVHSSMSREALCDILGIPADSRIVSIFPGSRVQEIRHSFPVFIAAAKQLLERVRYLKIVISVAMPHLKERIERAVKKAGLDGQVIYYDANSYDLMAHTELSMATSGTVTLEHAIMCRPCVVVYRFSPWTYWLIKLVIAKKFEAIKYISLPNIIMQSRMFPEFLQDMATPDNVTQASLQLLANPAQMAAIRKECESLLAKLGKAGVVNRAAYEILNVLFTHSNV